MWCDTRSHIWAALLGGGQKVWVCDAVRNVGPPLRQSRGVGRQRPHQLHFLDRLRRRAVSRRWAPSFGHDERRNVVYDRDPDCYRACIIFALIAGLRSVAWTDSLQAIIMIISATFIVVLVVKHLGGLGSFFDTLTTKHPGALSVPGNGFFNFSMFLGLTLPWMFCSISNPQVSQRLYSPRSLKQLRQMLLGFLVFGFIYTLVSVMWGFAAAIKFPDLATGDLATPTLLASEIIPPAAGVIVMVGIMAAAVSTIDSIMLTLSSMVARDVVGGIKPGISERRQLTIGKFVLPVIALLAYAFAQLELDLIAVLSVSASAGLLVLVPPTIGTFFWRRGTAAGVLTSVIAAGGLVFVLELTETKLLGQGSGVWGLAVSLVLFIGVSLATRAPEERATEFLEYSRSQLKRHRVL